MHAFLWAFLLTSLLWGSFAFPCHGADTAPDYDEILRQYEHVNLTPTTPPTYAPYPQPAPAPPPQKRSWLSRLLKPMTSQMSPPLYQAPKVPKESPKETEILADPLIRLAKPIHHEGSRVEPGFYILALQSPNPSSGASLTLFRQNKAILTVPALGMTTSTAVTPTTLPTPPKSDSKPPSAKVPHKTPPSVTGRVELSTDGNTLLLIYQKGSEEFSSVPLSVVVP